MKRLLKFLAAAAIFATAAGCTPDKPVEEQPDDTPVNDVLSAPELTATASEGTISFTWTSGTIENSDLICLKMESPLRKMDFHTPSKTMSTLRFSMIWDVRAVAAST